MVALFNFNKLSYLSSTSLINLLSDKRLEELSVQSKCAIIKSLHANGNIRDNSDVEDFVGKLILHTYGEELKDLKNLLMAGGTRFNLQKLIFIDIAEKNREINFFF